MCITKAKFLNFIVCGLQNRTFQSITILSIWQPPIFMGKSCTPRFSNFWKISSSVNQQQKVNSKKIN